MNRELEQALWQHLSEFGSPRDWIEDELRAGTIAHPKQAWRTLEKWSAKGLYDYGVALDLGWLVNGAKAPERIAVRGVLVRL